ncbi:hypothetical protein V8C44DRAFT_316051 [Trichoderma aethiopicum]
MRRVESSHHLIVRDSTCLGPVDRLSMIDSHGVSSSSSSSSLVFLRLPLALLPPLCFGGPMLPCVIQQLLLILLLHTVLGHGMTACTNSHRLRGAALSRRPMQEDGIGVEWTNLVMSYRIILQLLLTRLKPSTATTADSNSQPQHLRTSSISSDLVLMKQQTAAALDCAECLYGVTCSSEKYPACRDFGGLYASCTMVHT